MATMTEIRAALENDAKVLADAQARIAATRELLRAEVAARTNAVKSAEAHVEESTKTMLASKTVHAAIQAVYETYGKGAYLNVRVNLEDGSTEYKWPSMTVLAPGAGMPKTPKARGGAKTTYHYTALDLSLPKTVKPDGIGYDAWLGQGLTDAFNASANDAQKVEVASISPTLAAEGKSAAAIGSAVYKYRCDVVHQEVYKGTLTPVR